MTPTRPLTKGQPARHRPQGQGHRHQRPPLRRQDRPVQVRERAAVQEQEERGAVGGRGHQGRRRGEARLQDRGGRRQHGHLDQGHPGQVQPRPGRQFNRLFAAWVNFCRDGEVTFEEELCSSYFQMRNLGPLVTSVTVTAINIWLKK